MEGCRSKRVRAWVLVKAAKGQALAAARKIWEEIGQNGDTFVVRADVVAGHYDIVVPVDAAIPEDGESHKLLTEGVVSKIQNLDEVAETLTLVVGKHFPWPPNKGNGYVTEEEAALTNPGVQIGPQGNNPWG